MTTHLAPAPPSLRFNPSSKCCRSNAALRQNVPEWARTSRFHHSRLLYCNHQRHYDTAIISRRLRFRQELIARSTSIRFWVIRVLFATCVVCRCGSMSASPTLRRISCKAIVSNKVDFPVPVFPMTYTCANRSLSLIPNRCWSFRKSTCAKWVMSLEDMQRIITLSALKAQRGELACAAGIQDRLCVREFLPAGHKAASPITSYHRANISKDFDLSTFRLAIDHLSGSGVRSEGARHAMEGDRSGALYGGS